jgi:murein DD-endopeptidase MepM/ murein hydrolase activator NlpD
MLRSSHRLPYLVLVVGCASISASETSIVEGCEGAGYPAIDSSPYVIPFAVGTTVETGLGNCSSSFHSAGGPDQFATDFNLPSGTPFVAARAGSVSSVVDDQPSAGGGPGNRLSVDHGDGTSALYLHSPRDGILVEVGDQVEQGDTLGVVGQSGLAGYPHLHFTVVEGSTAYPYQGVPVTFRNADPADVPLRTNAVYTVLPY